MRPMPAAAPVALLLAFVVGACSLTSADRPSCLALAEAYVSIVRETVETGVPADVTERTLERAEPALSAAIEDGDTDQETRCRALIDLAAAARDLPPGEFAQVWTRVEAEGVLPSG